MLKLKRIDPEFITNEFVIDYPRGEILLDFFALFSDFGFCDNRSVLALWLFFDSFV